MGKHSYVSFSSKGTDRFKSLKGANPANGSAGEMEEVVEERVEVACEEGQVSKIIKANKKVQPYEEVAIDIYPMLTLKNYQY